MRATRQLSITLPIDMADMVKDKVASGDYASESEVVREGLRALKERETAVEDWLRRGVAEAYEEYLADPSSAVPLDEAFDRVIAELKDRTRSERK
jgi:putative addiction module CopG family antidote